MNNEEGKCAPSTFSCRWAFSHAENRPAWKKQKTSFRGREPAMIPAYNVSFHCYESKCSRPDLHFARAPVMVRDIKTTNRRHAAGLKSDSDRRNKKKRRNRWSKGIIFEEAQITMKNERIYIYAVFLLLCLSQVRGLSCSMYQSDWQGKDKVWMLPLISQFFHMSVLKMDERSGLHAFHPEYNYSVHWHLLLSLPWLRTGRYSGVTRVWGRLLMLHAGLQPLISLS